MLRQTFSNGLETQMEEESQIFAKQLQGKTPYYNVRIVLFGAEEVGLFGARHYVSSLIESQEIAHTDIVGMINLDTVIGGDMLYVHSAHALPYKCADSQANNFNSNLSSRRSPGLPGVV